jgi:transposase
MRRSFERVDRRRAPGGEKKIRGEPPDHSLGRSQGGFGTKLHLVTDGGGVLLSARTSPGQAHESRYLESVLEAVRLPQARPGPRRRRPRRLAGDKAYSAGRIRRYLHRRGIRAVIPHRADEGGRRPGFDREGYRRRYIVECEVGWLKESRRLGTRYEKHAVNYVAMVKLAATKQCLRRGASRDRA